MKEETVVNKKEDGWFVKWLANELEKQDRQAKEDVSAESIRDGYKERYRGDIAAKFLEDITALDPLFKRRHDIQGKIEGFQKLVDSFDSDIQDNLDKKISLEKKGVELLEKGEKPNFSKQLHDNEKDLDELEKWRGEAQQRIKALNDELDALEEMISREWYLKVLNPAARVLNQELAHLILRIEVVQDTFYDQMSRFEKENSITRANRPRIFIPYTKKCDSMLSAPKNAMKVIAEGLLER